MLMQLGTVTFEVAPLNMDTYDRDTGADLAVKDTMGNQRPHEFMGESDETIAIIGKLFPEKFGGLSTFEEVQRLRASGNSQLLVRGDGRNMGWFTIERLRERHTYIDPDGVGRMIDFEISLLRAPRPAAASYVQTLVRLIRGIL